MNFKRLSVIMMVIPLVVIGIFSCTNSLVYAMKEPLANTGEKDVTIEELVKLGKEVHNTQIQVLLETLVTATLALNQHKGALEHIGEAKKALQGALDAANQHDPNTREIRIGEIQGVLETTKKLHQNIASALPHIEEAEKNLHMALESLAAYQ